MADQPTPTDRRALASAANGRRSRGPITAGGKAVSRFNAIKHGIHARPLLITRGSAPEDAAELKSLYARFHDEFAPVGIAEELLLERLFVTYWRMRRILHGETALFDNPNAEDEEFAELVRRALALPDDDDDDPAVRLAPREPAPAPKPEPVREPEPPEFNPAIIDRVTRYEGPLEKAFYRALRELLDLQTRRRARARTRPTQGEEEEESK